MGENTKGTLGQDASHVRKEKQRLCSCLPNMKKGKNDKDFTLRRTFAETLELMCEESTAHGIAHTWNNRFNYLGLFWFIVVVILLFFTGNAVIQLIVNFHAREVKSQTTSILSRQGLQLPSTALCNRAYFSRRKLKALNVSSALTNYLYGITGTLIAVDIEYLRSERSNKFMAESHEELMALLAERNLTFRELVDAISYDCEDILLMCSVANIRMSGKDCCRAMPPIPTFAAKCYIFYTNETHMQAMEGEYLGVSFYLKVDADDYPVLDPEIMNMEHFLKTGLQISVFSNQTHPSIPAVGQGVSLVPKVYTTIEVSLSVVNVERKKTSFDWNEKECALPSTISYNGDPDTFFTMQPNCQFSSTRKCFEAINNCSHYALDNNTGDLLAPCPMTLLKSFYNTAFQKMLVESKMINDGIYIDVDKDLHPLILECLFIEERKCQDPCIRYDYGHATSHTPIQQAVYRKLHTGFGLTNKSELATVTIFYPTMRFTDVRLWRENLSDLVSEIGGITGLLLGISIVTMIEVFVAWVLGLNILIRNVREKFSQRVSPKNSPGDGKTHQGNTIIGVSKFSFSVQQFPEKNDQRVQLVDNFLGTEIE